MKTRDIVECSEPNLLTDMFPHRIPPAVVFDGPVTEEVLGTAYTVDPSEMRGRDIHITDTTFRDGQQSRPPYTVDQILTLFGFLARLSGPTGVIRQTEFFLYSAADRESGGEVSGAGLSIS